MEGVGREGEGFIVIHQSVSGLDAGFSYRGGATWPTHNHTHI